MSRTYRNNDESEIVMRTMDRKSWREGMEDQNINGWGITRFQDLEIKIWWMLFRDRDVWKTIPRKAMAQLELSRPM